jgi:DNA repair protein SbcC/Rad50
VTLCQPREHQLDRAGIAALTRGRHRRRAATAVFVFLLSSAGARRRLAADLRGRSATGDPKGLEKATTAGNLLSPFGDEGLRMQPLKLTLKGFRGLRDGLGLPELTLDVERLAAGAELIAIAGANGSGKSTIMDSLVPLIGLPSRAANAGPGDFSYYDYVYLPESLKDLTWSHEGRCYRSQIVVRMNGSRRKTEAFLHGLDDERELAARADVRQHGVRWAGEVVHTLRGIHLRRGRDVLHVGVRRARKTPTQHLPQCRDQDPTGRPAGPGGDPLHRLEGQRGCTAVEGGAGGIRQEQAGRADELARVKAARHRLEGVESRMAHAEGAK